LIGPGVSSTTWVLTKMPNQAFNGTEIRALRGFRPVNSNR